MLTGAALAVTVAGATTFAFLWHGARAELSARDIALADQQRAREVATAYAVSASTIDYQHIDAWTTDLKANTSAQLTSKFVATAPQLHDILVPLQWKSTATPIAATVTDGANGIYQVSVFLDVQSSSVQAPEGVKSTVTYTVSVDPAGGWTVTDIGGLPPIPGPR
ncbi:hypothetical protein ACFC06_00550 [Nocardia sp. NPDC056064]|uniref:hypothetical protein n=1 Tax=Nocardia sp. NPDC056064 TaxID=3345701 RepID=UPI0035DB5AFD